MSLLDDRVLLVSSEERGETDKEEEEEERKERGEEEGGSGEVGPEERGDGECGAGECGAGDVGVQYEAGRESCVRRVFGVEVAIALCAFFWGLHEVLDLLNDNSPTGKISPIRHKRMECTSCSQL